MPQDRETRIPDIFAPIAEGIAQHIASPPLVKNRKRAQWGAGLLAWCAYTAILLKSGSGYGISDAVTFVRGLPSAPPEVWVPAAIWGVGALLGLLWLSVGLRNLRGQPRDVMAAVWAVLLGGLFIAALWYGWYLSPDWVLLNFLLQGTYWAMLVLEVVTFWLAVRSPSGGGAMKLIRRQIERQSIKWRTGARRQF